MREDHVGDYKPTGRHGATAPSSLAPSWLIECAPMSGLPLSTIVIVFGSWLLLAALAVLAFRFNRGRSDD